SLWKPAGGCCSPRRAAKVRGMRRREFLKLAGGVSATAALPCLAMSQATYPSRPVRIIVGFAAGGGVDITARLIGQWLSDRLRPAFLLEDKGGGGGALRDRARAKP